MNSGSSTERRKSRHSSQLRARTSWREILGGSPNAMMSRERRPIFRACFNALDSTPVGLKDGTRGETPAVPAPAAQEV